MKPPKIKKIIFSSIVVLIGAVLYVAISIFTFGNVNQIRKADAAIVLAAGNRGDRPSPVFEERIKHGIWLYKNGYVNKIVFTGGRGGDEESSESSVAKNYAMENLVPAGDIFIEEKSAITRENLYYATQIVKENHMTNVIIVSDPLHMKRSMWMAEDFGLVAYSSPTPTTRYRTLKSKLVFLAREEFYYFGYMIQRLFHKEHISKPLHGF